MQNIKGIYNLLEDFSNRHLSLNDFGFGNISNLQTKNVNLPILWVDLKSAIINKDSTALSFDYYVLDLLKGDYSNYIDILNDTLIIGRDLITEFYDNYEVYGFDLNENNVSSEKYEEFTDHFLLGYKFTVDINDWSGFNLCAIPINGFTQSNIKIYLPDESDVLDGVLYGLNYENEGTFECPDITIPDESDVLLGVIYGEDDSLVGTYECPIQLEYQFKSDYLNLISFEGIALDGVGEDELFWTILKMTTNSIGEVLSNDRFEFVKWSDRYIL